MGSLQPLNFLIGIFLLYGLSSTAAFVKGQFLLPLFSEHRFSSFLSSKLCECFLSRVDVDPAFLSFYFSLRITFRFGQHELHFSTDFLSSVKN